MLSYINLLGRLPYRLEYSQSLNRKSGSAYKNPYGVIYSSPFEESFSDYRSHYAKKPYKIGRVLSEYDFYTNFKRKPTSNARLSMDF